MWFWHGYTFKTWDSVTEEETYWVNQFVLLSRVNIYTFAHSLVYFWSIRVQGQGLAADAEWSADL